MVFRMHSERIPAATPEWDIMMACHNIPANRFTLKVVSRSLAGAPELLSDFNPALN